MVSLIDAGPALTANDEYECLTPLPGQFAHVRFRGTFEQKTVIWDAHVYTTAYWYRQAGSDLPAPTHQQFIEVGEMTTQGRRIEIGLNVASIDHATILKTMTMVRQYKRLHRGRHQYGQADPVER